MKNVVIRVKVNGKVYTYYYEDVVNVRYMYDVDAAIMYLQIVLKDDNTATFAVNRVVDLNVF